MLWFRCLIAFPRLCCNVFCNCRPVWCTSCSPVRVEGENSSSHPGPAPVGSSLLPDLSVKKLGRHHPRQDAQTERENREKVVIRQDVEVINTSRWSVIWAGVVTWRSPRGRTPPYEYSHWQSWRGTASGIKFSSDTDWSSAPEEWSNKHKLFNPHSDSGWLTMKWKQQETQNLQRWVSCSVRSRLEGQEASNEGSTAERILYYDLIDNSTGHIWISLLTSHLNDITSDRFTLFSVFRHILHETLQLCGCVGHLLRSRVHRTPATNTRF